MDPIATAEARNHHIDSIADHHYSALIVDLDASASNYRMLSQVAKNAVCSAVLKADGYGLGAIPIARRLSREGCTHYFVAYLDEAIALREAGLQGELYVLNGLLPSTETHYLNHQLTPVLCDLNQIRLWKSFANQQERVLPAVLHVDTGMTRTGIPSDELAILADDPSLLRGLDIKLVMSQMAYSCNPENPFNTEQRQRFLAAQKILPPAPGSLAKSATIFWGDPYRFDLVRPGIALHGAQPNGKQVPLTPVMSLWARIYQVQNVTAGQSVGYVQSYQFQKPGRVATLCLGYADGYPWSLANKGYVTISGYKAPLVGRVSMDLVTVDVTDIPEALVHPGTWAQVVGGSITIDDIAKQAGTVAYEVLLGLGKRFHRVYTTNI